MDSEAVFKRYDIRGSHPDEIDEEFAERLGKAIGTFASRHSTGKVAVSRDTRESSKTLAPSLIDGLRETCREIIDIGVGPTDRLALAAKHHRAIGAMITASHLGWEMTGCKLVYQKGNGFSNDDLDTVKEVFREQDFDESPACFEVGNEAEFDDEYIEEATAFLTEYAEDEKPTVCIDCANGAAYRIAPRLFTEVGFTVVEHNCDSTPDRTLDPEPKPGNRDGLVQRCQKNECDIGVAFDPDADRVIYYDPEIGWLDGNQAFYVLARLIDAEAIAASVDTSQLLEELDAEIHYARVGDIFVSALGIEEDVDLLGEPNGHFAVPAFSWYNSGVVVGALLASQYRQVREIVGSMPEYVTVRETYYMEEGEDRDERMEAAIKYAAKNHEIVSTVDGVKYRVEDATVLVRPSGTSQKIRIVGDGRDREAVEAAVEAVYKILSA